MVRRVAFVAALLALTWSASVAPAALTGPRATAGAAPLPRAASAPRIRWHGCGESFDCSTLTVPVDYAKPDGEQVDIALSRVPAFRSRDRAGTLVLNFGGPGDPGTATLRDFVYALPSSILDRYDVISFDPRGTGSSRPVDCVDDHSSDLLAAADPTPDGPDDLPHFYDGTAEPVDVVAGCVARQGSWLAQVGTRNVARDLDRLRAGLNVDRLDYIGFSYGTVIGAVYAQMFPTHVGRFVLDSPVDLSATDDQELDDDANGFEDALTAFLDDCGRRAKCAFHSGGDPDGALSRLQARFERGLELPTLSKGRTTDRPAGVGAFYTALVASLYDKQYGWPELAGALRSATKGDGTPMLAIADAYNGRAPDGSYDNIDEAIGVILCDDRFDPMPSFADFVSTYQRLAASNRFLGGYAASEPAGCDPRLPRPPASDMLGDVRASGIPPILVVGTTGDPATPFAGAEEMQRRLDGSRLITFVSTEHTAYLKSACIDRAVNAYLLQGALPAEGTRCRP